MGTLMNRSAICRFLIVAGLSLLPASAAAADRYRIEWSAIRSQQIDSEYSVTGWAVISDVSSPKIIECGVIIHFLADGQSKITNNVCRDLRGQRNEGVGRRLYFNAGPIKTEIYSAGYVYWSLDAQLGNSKFCVQDYGDAGWRIVCGAPTFRAGAADDEFPRFETSK
jgi:hypothetical protein